MRKAYLIMKRELAYVWDPIMEASTERIDADPMMVFGSREQAEEHMKDEPEYKWYIEEIPFQE